jgi:septal ring factor EnvC (AmiA/AmiB activator)
MDATSDRATTPNSVTYSSRPGALVWSFRKSRDGWKRKYQELKARVKTYQNQIAAVTKSREQWKSQAKDTQQQLLAFQAENAELRTRVEALEKKSAPDMAR